MIVNHINLCSSDVRALARTLVGHLGFEVIQEGQVPAQAKAAEAGSYFAMLRDKNEFYVVITQIEHKDESAYPKGFHFAVMLDTANEVRAKRDEMVAHGYEAEPVNEFEALGAKWTAFYFQAGDGLKVEINTFSKRVSELECH